MRPIIEGPPDERAEPRRSLWRRLGWFFGLALASGAAVALAALALKALLPSA